MVAISLMSAFTSRAEVLFDRRRLSLPSKHGCRETWTLDGRDILGKTRFEYHDGLSGISGQAVSVLLWKIYREVKEVNK